MLQDRLQERFYDEMVSFDKGNLSMIDNAKSLVNVNI
jgi:hypothetical protein